ncbi:MAG: excinuclease ABC subunit UvrC [Clostridia bacterium]|nr:excinuclease ABC subunit UvrC [Clostridia bacterium]
MKNVNIEKLQNKVKSLPLSSGVYLMKNENGGIIYVGKAKRLRNRVKSYFDNSPKNIKTQIMASQVYDFDYILTDSEFDAFNLENTLIKKYKPKYNILLKDDKSFPYIYINREEKFPRVQVVRRPKVSKGLFGPFVTGMNVYDIIDCIKSAFKIRRCNSDFSRVKKARACLHGELGECSKPCVNAVSESEYNAIIDDVCDFLNGNTKKIRALLTEKMQQFSDSEQFEKAIEIRRELSVIDLLDKEILTDLIGTKAIDVFALSQTDELSDFNVMMIRNGKNVGQINFPSTITFDDVSEALTSFIGRFYASAGALPKEIVCAEISREQADLIERLFEQNFGVNVKVTIPAKATKLHLCENAKRNASEYVLHSQDRIARHNKLTREAEIELAKILKIGNVSRIEGYDISNISGKDSVASMVVFVDGEPAKSEYRKFKIKTVEGADDYASLAETLSRRLTRLKNGEKNWAVAPDVILIDGGLGQLHAVSKVLDEFNLNISVISLAKKDEEVFVTGSNIPIALSRDNVALKLLQRVRDESHRFAVLYHRLARSKNYKSMLSEIEGIGKLRQNNLYKEFKTAEAIMNASVGELARVDGIGEKTAETIYKSLHKD